MRVSRSRNLFLAGVVCLTYGQVAFGAVATPVDVKADEPVRRRSQEMARRVDELLAQQWTAAKVEPAAAASDGEFLRRASLDLTGVIPRASQVRGRLA